MYSNIIIELYSFLNFRAIGENNKESLPSNIYTLKSIIEKNEKILNKKEEQVQNAHVKIERLKKQYNDSLAINKKIVVENSTLKKVNKSLQEEIEQFRKAYFSQENVASYDDKSEVANQNLKSNEAGSEIELPPEDGKKSTEIPPKDAKKMTGQRSEDARKITGRHHEDARKSIERQRKNNQLPPLTNNNFPKRSFKIENIKEKECFSCKYSKYKDDHKKFQAENVKAIRSDTTDNKDKVTKTVNPVEKPMGMMKKRDVSQNRASTQSKRQNALKNLKKNNKGQPNVNSVFRP